MRYLKAFIAIGVAVAVAVIIIIGRDARREAVFYPFGGIPLKVVAYDRSQAEFDEDMKAVSSRVAKLSSELDRHDSGSEIARINRDASVAPVVLGDDMERILARCYRWYPQSRGAFDPTVVPLIELWEGAGESGELPPDAEVDVARQRVGLGYVAITHDGRIMFAREGMGLDFGAIAKGFIADEVARLLVERGVARGIVDVGGNALAFGEGTFTFGVADPSSTRESQNLMGTVEVERGAVITSGNYERYVTIDGRRFSHIIDPRTGRPVANGLVAATVIGGEGVDADAMATACMVLGKEEAMGLLSSVPEVSAILVEHEGEDWRVWASKALQPRLNLSDNWADKVEWF